MSELAKKDGTESPEISEEAINEMRAWSGQDPESKAPERRGFITSMFETSLLGSVSIIEPFKMFFFR